MMFMIKPAEGTRFVELEQAGEQVLVRVDGMMVVAFAGETLEVYEENASERRLTVEKR